MRELEKKSKDKVVIEKQQQKEDAEYVLDQRIHPHKNHRLWEINVETEEVKLAEFNKDNTYKLKWSWKKSDGLQSHRSLIKNPKCVYISALNEKNALKHYKNKTNGSKF